MKGEIPTFSFLFFLNCHPHNAVCRSDERGGGVISNAFTCVYSGFSAGVFNGTSSLRPELEIVFIINNKV